MARRYAVAISIIACACPVSRSRMWLNARGPNWVWTSALARMVGNLCQKPRLKQNVANLPRNPAPTFHATQKHADRSPAFFRTLSCLQDRRICRDLAPVALEDCDDGPISRRFRFRQLSATKIQTLLKMGAGFLNSKTQPSLSTQARADLISDSISNEPRSFRTCRVYLSSPPQARP